MCLQCRRPGLNPWVRKIPWIRKWQPAPVFLPGESHGRRSPMGYINPWGRKESDTTKRLHFKNLKQQPSPNPMAKLWPTLKSLSLTAHWKGSSVIEELKTQWIYIKILLQKWCLLIKVTDKACNKKFNANFHTNVS